MSVREKVVSFCRGVKTFILRRRAKVLSEDNVPRKTLCDVQFTKIVVLQRM